MKHPTSRDLRNGQRLYEIDGLPDTGAVWGDDEKVVLAIYDGIFAYLLFVNFGTNATAFIRPVKSTPKSP